MSAVAETVETTTPDDPFAGIDLERLLTTPREEPADASPTPTPEPASEPEATRDESETAPPERGARERDERGRFQPRDGATPDATPEPDPPAEARPDAPADDPRAEAARLRRELAAVRGNVDNAARQAAEKARQEALAEAERQERARISRVLAEYEQQGHDVSAAREEWRKEWQRADEAKREQEDQRRRAGLMLSEVETDAQQKLLNLYHQGANVLAQDTGLPVEEVRTLWADPEERERFLRASMQAAMARRLPGAGFNAEALNDYMAAKVEQAKHLAGVRQAHSAEIAALRKEIDKLQQQLNRQEGDSPALRPETPARGAGPRRKEPTTLEEAHAELERRLQAAR